MNFKGYVKQHPKVLRLAHVLLRRSNGVVYSWDDVNLMVDDWCRVLPFDYDCIVGVPRQGLMIADRIALQSGCSLSTPDDFLRGVVWQSRALRLPEKFKKVLVVDDSATQGRELVAAIHALRVAFPKVKFESAVLIKHESCKLRIDYAYLTQDRLLLQGDGAKLPRNLQGGHVRLLYEDFS